MKKMLSLLALGLSLSLGHAMAADEKAPSGQQNRMKTCNADATGKKGDERKAFMKQCLSNKASASSVVTTPSTPATSANAAQTTPVASGNATAAAKAATGATGAAAATPPTNMQAAGSQQGKMKTCNADAKGKTGEERKTFMKECLAAQ